jgi:4-coumarate--CoA ligase
MALFTPNCADVATVMFGTLWAGGIVCPLNNLSKMEELTSYLKSSGAKGLTTHISCLDVARAAARAAGLPLDRILLVGDRDCNSKTMHISSLQHAGNSVGKASINPMEDLAFLVYSSGTTGQPKGVMLSHENMVANALQNTTLDEGNTKWENDRNMGFLPLYHIYG